MKAKFILSEKKALEQLEIMKSLSDEVSYSVKTNLEVAKILENKCFMSVHSLQNLKLLKNKEKVWFFLQGNKEVPKGVTNFVVDNENDLKLLLNENRKINLLLRMKLREHTIHTGKHFVFGFSSSKINELLKELKNNKNINQLGIHFHRKTQNVSEWNLKEELEDSIKDFSSIDLINIGGGIPAEYKNFRKEVKNHIFNKIRELKTFLNEKNIKMIIEPGRSIAAPSIKLECEVINVYDNNVIVNASIYNSAMDTFVAHIRLLAENEVEIGHCYTIKGFTPDSLDIFRYKVYFDKELKVGDKITFLNAGAYNYSSNYFNLDKVETEIVL
ncbi:decarboxylase [Candidatus Woesearchaeota archaeon]|jgi:ornithine decarboxylase|nr:decarboxylase [Candidatus Woesearchaeota archaeon]MBT7474633.1 decarboxylase [Candidatus Woesearchaeota archaeon]